MSEAALLRVAHLIKVEDDLDKIPSIMQQLFKEKALVDVKLNTAKQSQIDAIINNLKNLNDTAAKMSSIKASLNKVNLIYDESVTNIKDYDTIRSMTGVYQFLVQVQNLTRDISKYKGFLDHINKEIDDELEIISEDIHYPLERVLQIHFSLTQAWNLKDYLEKESSNLSDDLQLIIFKIVAPLKKTIRKFDELLREIIISTTEALKDDNTQLIYKLIKIVDYELVEDLKFELMDRLGLQKGAKTLNYATYRGAKRNYRKFFYDKLEESLVDIFDKCVEHFQTDKMLVYDNLDWLEDELMFVANTFAPMFPQAWDINNFIQNVYYNKLHKFTMDIIESDPPAEDLMRILAYDAHYSDFVVALKSDEDKKIKKEQKSIIGEELKNVVLEDYLKVIVTKMDEWNNTLIEQETDTLVLRESPPDRYSYLQQIEDEDGLDQIITLELETEVYVLPDFKTTLTMLKEQADVAADSGYGKILVGVIEHWLECYIKRAVNYLTIIDEEFDKYMSVFSNERHLIKESKTRALFRRKRVHAPAWEEVDNMTEEQIGEITRGGLIEYLTALGNTYEINTERLQDKFLPTYREKVHTTYQGRIEKAFEDTLGPTNELNAQVIRTIVEIIINDLVPALSQVFTKSWYEDKTQTDEPSIAERMVETIVEYMGELRGYASYEMYSITFNVLLDRFISSYIRIGYENILHGQGKKIDPTATKRHKSFAPGVGRDVTIFYTSLEKLFTRKDAAYLLNSLRAIEFLGDLATCEDPVGFVPEMWENEILGSFYHCSVEYVKGVLLCRDDMDVKTVNVVVAELVDRQRQYHQNVESPAILVGTLNDFAFE